MRRADRLFQIVQKLRRGKLTTARDLAQWLEVSERTIYRDIADLMKSGLPIDGEAGLGYLMREGYDLPPLMFTEDEIVALRAGVEMVRAWGGTGMARGADSALDKITSVLPDALRDRAEASAIHAIPRAHMTEDTRTRIDRIEQAITDHVRLHISYEDGAMRQTGRVIRPLVLLFWGPVWTLGAWCELRMAFRMFRVDRIADATLGLAYEPEPGQTLQDFYANAAAQGAPHQGPCH